MLVVDCVRNDSACEAPRWAICVARLPSRQSICTFLAFFPVRSLARSVGGFTCMRAGDKQLPTISQAGVLLCARDVETLESCQNAFAACFPEHKLQTCIREENILTPTTIYTLCGGLVVEALRYYLEQT